MINKNKIMNMAIIYILVLFFCTSCTMFETKSQIIKKQQEPIVEPIISEIPQQQSKQSLYADLEKKGDDEIKAGNYRSGLNIYNNLISKYSGNDKNRILDKTEALLSIMKNSDLEVVLQSSKSQIPKSMLLYRIGINYAQKQKDNQKAKEIFTQFISSYPDDPRILEIEQILKDIEKNSFSKNTIGCMLPLSGKYQTFGNQALRGIKMAEKEIKELYTNNMANNIELNKDNISSEEEILFIIKDTESKDEKAVQCVQEFFDTNVAAIAGPMVTSEIAAKEAQKYQIPMVCMTQKSEVTETGDYIFSNFITPEMQIKGLVSHARGVLGIDKFAVFAPNDKYGQRFMSLYRQAVSEAGGEIVVAEVYRANQTDFSEAVKKIAAFQPQTPTEEPKVEGTKSESNGVNTNPDALYNNILPNIALFIPDSPSKAATILPQLLYNNVKDVYLLGTNIWHNNALLKIAPEHLKNVVITDGYFAQSKNPESSRFAEAFKAVYGEYPGFIEAVAYDTASILIKTAMDSSIDSRAALKNALAGNMLYNGATGKTMFETNGNAEKELFFLKVENNSFVEIELH